MTLPEIPEAAVDAVLDYHGANSTLRRHEPWREMYRADIRAAWPELYAVALGDFADRMERTRELIGAGDDPFRFVAASARQLAHDARVATSVASAAS